MTLKKVRDITKILTHLTEIYKKQQALSLVVKKTFLDFAIVMQSVVQYIEFSSIFFHVQYSPQQS